MVSISDQSHRDINHRLRNQFRKYLRWETWTPVQGALLLAGIHPSAQWDAFVDEFQWGSELRSTIREKISRRVISPSYTLDIMLEGGRLSKNSRRLSDFATIMYQWDDWCNDRRNDDEVIPMELTHHEFVAWWLDERVDLYDSTFVEIVREMLFSVRPRNEKIQRAYLFAAGESSLKANRFITQEVLDLVDGPHKQFLSTKDQNLVRVADEIQEEISREGKDPYDASEIYRCLLARVKAGRVRGAVFVDEIPVGKNKRFTYRQDGALKAEICASLQKRIRNARGRQESS